MAAPNGARRTRDEHPAVPLTAGELADCAADLLDAGVSVLHLHVRDTDGGHTLDVDRYRAAIDAVRRYPDRLRAYCAVNPNYPEQLDAVLPALDALIPEVYLGFKFLPDYHGIALTDDRCRPAWEYADARELLVLTHTWGGSPHDGPDVVREVAERGAGEIVLNCMNQDGVRQGYDIPQLSAVRAESNVPLIASGGAGAREHFARAFKDADVDGALAASVFHSAEIHIGDLKTYLIGHSIDMRT